MSEMLLHCTMWLTNQIVRSWPAVSQCLLMCLWIFCETFALQTDILDEDKRLVSAVDYYFIQEDGARFKVRTGIRTVLVSTRDINEQNEQLVLWSILMMYLQSGEQASDQPKQINHCQYFEIICLFHAICSIRCAQMHSLSCTFYHFIPSFLMSTSRC